jgi:hypothetical protein
VSSRAAQDSAPPSYWREQSGKGANDDYAAVSPPSPVARHVQVHAILQRIHSPAAVPLFCTPGGQGRAARRGRRPLAPRQRRPKLTAKPTRRMSKPTATTLLWRMRLPERVRRIEIKSPVARLGFLFALLEKLRSFKQRRAISVAPCGNEPVPAGASGQTHQWPQQERDARYQRTEAASQDEKKKVFHAAILLLRRRRLSRQSVPAICLCGAGLP